MTVLAPSTMSDCEECFFAYPNSPEKPKSPLKEMSNQQLLEKAIDKSVAVARYNRAERERTSQPDYDPYNDPYGPSEDMEVSGSNDRLTQRELDRVQITRPFACRCCYEEFQASEAAPAESIVVLEHGRGWGGGWAGDWKTSREVHVYCTSCEKVAKGKHEYPEDLCMPR